MKHMLVRSLLAVLFLSTPLWAQGFGLYDQGVQGQGNAGAFTARAEDSTALFYNPAGLARLGSSEVSLAGKFTSSRSFYSNAGQSSWRSGLSEEVLPSLFYNHQFGKIGVGVGTTVTNDYEINWDQEDYPGRFLYNQSNFQAKEHMLGMGYRLTDALSVGGSLRFAQLDYGLGSSRPRPFVTQDPSQFFETQESYTLDGTGTGFSLGLQYYKLRRYAIGFNYQSAIDIDLSGARSFAQLTALEDPRAIASFESLFQNADARTSFELPERISIGYSTRLTVRTRLEVDVTQEGWSQEETRILTENSSGAPEEIVIPRRWNDTYSIRVGADFQQRRALAWRMGMGIARSVVPEDTFQPDFPDYDRFFYSFGASYTMAKRYTLELAWQLIQNRDRKIGETELVFDPYEPDYTVSNGQAGVYETQRVQVNLGLRVRLGDFK